MDAEDRVVEQEKITINMTPVDLGKIDLLVGQGAYSTRADFIRTAIRRLLEDNQELVATTIEKELLTIGVELISRRFLERCRTENTRVQYRVVGLIHLASDVDPDLADEVIESIKVSGVLRAPPAVIERLGDRVLVNGRRGRR